MPVFPLFGYIPSPDTNVIDIGPLSIHVYGITFALGVLVGSWFWARRWKARGHDPKEVYDVVVVAVVAGIIGARLYHVITDYQRFEGHWSRVFEVWKGGLGIWGGVLVGSLAVLGYARWKRYDGVGLLDALAPCIAIAQAIGRLGNWFNQELFGEPTRLPWALEIDRAHRPKGYEQFATFHPTFLYEGIYNIVVVVGVLLWVEHRYRLKRGQSFALYVVLYTFGRFWLENLRIDDAHVILGLRVNAWVSLLVFLFGVAWFVWLGRRPEPGAATTPDPTAAVGGQAPDR